jgi:hypothetical protein
MSGNTYTSPFWKGDSNAFFKNHHSVFYKTERWFFCLLPLSEYKKQFALRLQEITNKRIISPFEKGGLRGILFDIAKRKQKCLVRTY